MKKTFYKKVIPIPEPEGPRPNEDEKTFVSRCVSHEGFKEAHPDKDERLARCFKMWRDSQKED